MLFKLFVTAALAAAAAMYVLVREDSICPAHFAGSAARSAGSMERLNLPETPGRVVGLGVFEQLANDPRVGLDRLLQATGKEGHASLCADPQFRSALMAAADRLLETTRLQAGDAHVPALESFVQLWAAVDLASADQWVHRIPAGRSRHALMVRLAYVESQSSPAEAARRVVDEIPPGHVQEEAVAMVLHQWALQDFSSAAAWVDLFPEGKTRERAINELAGIRDYSLAEVPQ